MIYLVGERNDQILAELWAAGVDATVTESYPVGIEAGDLIVLAQEPISRLGAHLINAYQTAGAIVLLEDAGGFNTPPMTEYLEDTYDPHPRREGTVHFVASDRGGSGRWRSAWPATVLEDAGYRVNVEISSVWTETVRLSKDDLVIAHRPEFSSSWLGIQRKIQANGIPVLVDEDDDITAIPTSFDSRFRHQARARLPDHDQAIREADGLIVSTPRLEEVYGPLAKQTWVMPNLIPEWVFHAGAKLDANNVKVGWAGITRTHLHDLHWVKPEIQRALEGATFTSVGDDLTPGVLGLPRSECETRGIIYDPSLFYREMSRADIGIVPLDPSEPLNLAKSYIKALEYMALGRPVVVTRLPEQEKLVTPGTGFLASSPMEFADHVQRLVRDRRLRERMGQAAQERARAFTLNARGAQWLAVLDGWVNAEDQPSMQRAGV